jgi:hypothetical protein
MLEQLMQLIQQQGQQSVVENPAVPNEQNEAVMQEAQSSITAGLQQMAANGNISQLTQMMQGGQVHTDNPAVQQISGNFIQNITQKFGINSQAASSIAASIIPNVLSRILNRNNAGSQGGFDIGGLLQSLTGGNNATGGVNSGGFMQQASNIGAKLGLDKDGDGDVDFNDITKMFKG